MCVIERSIEGQREFSEYEVNYHTHTHTHTHTHPDPHLWVTSSSLERMCRLVSRERRDSSSLRRTTGLK